VTESIEITRRLPMAATRAWGFLAGPAVQARFLGEGSSLAPRATAAVRLARSGQPWRQGEIAAVTAGQRIEIRLFAPQTWQAGHGTATVVTLSVAADPADGAAVVTASESGFDGLGGGCDPAAAQAEASRYWEAALDRLVDLASAARQRRKRVAQAVVVIHGIGEQIPGATVRAFVQAVAEPGERSGVRSHPDTISPGFELRRWRLDPTASRPATDFFEGYWASEVRDTSMGQVLSWLRMLLIRRPSTVPSGLKSLWWGCWVTAALAVSAVLLIGATDLELTDPGGLLALAVPVVLGVVNGCMVQSVGDAARYLWPHPANVAVRDRVRGKGVALLEALHDSGRYDRIVVVGHSLGSVIAYDIVGHAWIRMHRRHAVPSRTTNQAAVALDSGVTSDAAPSAAEGRPLQWAAWKEIRANTQPWLISDLVTVGSPLAHAGMLLAHSPPELEAAIQRTELASCPPSPPDEVWFDGSYHDPFGARHNFRYYTDHAQFAVTRWSNLFFPVRAALFGDVVGGPLVGVFGRWIDDKPVRFGGNWWRTHTPLAHTSYWTLPKTGEASSDHLTSLKAALDLDRRRDLEQIAEAIPAEAWLEAGA
jgi:hypothetical protein